MQKCFPKYWHLIDQYNIPDNSFIIDNKVHNVPCIFQIWEKKESQRWIPEIQIPTSYTFVKKDENPHFSLRRVGVYAGKIDIDKLKKFTEELSQNQAIPNNIQNCLKSFMSSRGKGHKYLIN